MDYAAAVNMLNDEISAACARANDHGLSDEEVVAELRRLADEIEKEQSRGR